MTYLLRLIYCDRKTVHFVCIVRCRGDEIYVSSVISNISASGIGVSPVAYSGSFTLLHINNTYGIQPQFKQSAFCKNISDSKYF